MINVTDDVGIIKEHGHYRTVCRDCYRSGYNVSLYTWRVKLLRKEGVYEMFCCRKLLSKTDYDRAQFISKGLNNDKD